MRVNYKGRRSGTMTPELFLASYYCINLSCRGNWHTKIPPSYQKCRPIDTERSRTCGVGRLQLRADFESGGRSSSCPSSARGNASQKIPRCQPLSWTCRSTADRQWSSRRSCPSWEEWGRSRPCPPWLSASSGHPFLHWNVFVGKPWCGGIMLLVIFNSSYVFLFSFLSMAWTCFWSIMHVIVFAKCILFNFISINVIILSVIY